MHMSESEVFEEGISCALFKLAEVGELTSAEILLRYGANLHFEGSVKTSNFWLYFELYSWRKRILSNIVYLDCVSLKGFQPKLLAA